MDDIECFGDNGTENTITEGGGLHYFIVIGGGVHRIWHKEVFLLCFQCGLECLALLARLPIYLQVSEPLKCV